MAISLTTKTNTVATIESQSSKVLDVFNRTVTDLNSINAKIDSEVDAKNKQIEVLTSETSYLSGLKAKHDKVIGKINALFQD